MPTPDYYYILLEVIDDYIVICNLEKKNSIDKEGNKEIESYIAAAMEIKNIAKSRFERYELSNNKVGEKTK